MTERSPGHPSRFFKYVTPAVAGLILSTGRLRWSSPGLFDDKTEFRRMPRFDPPIETTYRAFVDRLIAAASGGGGEIVEEKLSPRASLLFRLIGQSIHGGVSGEELREIGDPVDGADGRVADVLAEWVKDQRPEAARILCVTTDDDNDDLWNRYAAQGCGAVLGFRHLEEFSTPLLAAKQVVYTASPPVVGSGVDFLLYGNTPELRRRTLEAICFTKKDEWSAQREWRALTWRSDEGGAFGDYLFYPDELESVTCGRNATEDFRSEIRHLVESKFLNCQFGVAPPVSISPDRR